MSVPVNGRPTDSVEVLDTATGIWSTAAPLPTPRSNHPCAVVGSLLYVVGGFGVTK